MIRLTKDAESDLEGIAGWITRDSGSARADSVTARILASFRQVECFPLIGRPGRIDGTRELLVSGLPHISVYEVQGADVVILRVLHGAQEWPR